MNILGYYPNVIARSLANRKTNTIGLIMPSFSDMLFINPFFPEALRGISSVLSENSYDILMSTNSKHKEELESIQKFIRGKRVDGIILMSSRVKDECIEFLKQSKFPFVVIGSSLEYNDINFVDNDNEKATYDITNYLIQKGCSNIALIAGSIDLVVTINRLSGYKKALQENDIQINNEYIVVGEFLEESGYISAKRLLSLENIPDAIIVADDIMALGVIKAIKEKNLKIPEDISIASFNNSILAKTSTPTLTSVDVNPLKLGMSAASILINSIDKNDKSKSLVVDYEIIFRDSTK
ncbi:transcriptional regulator, LacI family [Alkalithermobacter thermoalcaliphilus JW-YL-7 = DSM 7308]|uniref:LacI family transcriptional regulator n=2 Tax=Clostridium paradoxum TaxID=29346 RepID=A0A150FSS5_CLOPD|nr:LacI family transcriptional regulator [[Clostridium] paradoxum JW-YL-7 = DSM 7308]SHL20343.1 transcriptional regulator, LacI family [[Clostridium] paradoxum JW-YL-7 = DSM 7308]